MACSRVSESSRLVPRRLLEGNSTLKFLGLASNPFGLANVNSILRALGSSSLPAEFAIDLQNCQCKYARARSFALVLAATAQHRSSS
jgi:hypothetical protein